MNSNHALCGTPEWAAHLHNEVLPSVTRGVQLGAELLELGPGPGAATEWLHSRVERVVAVELEADAADALAARFHGSNVQVVRGNAASLDFADCSFDSVASFTMLHHLETRAQQVQLLREALRVLRPGGVLIGADSLHSNALHHFHVDDTYNPIDPGTLLTILQVLGYQPITVAVTRHLEFAAHRPVDELGEEDRT
jgi:SAM-dependent methyltransferase